MKFDVIVSTFIAGMHLGVVCTRKRLNYNSSASLRSCKSIADSDASSRVDCDGDVKL